MERTRDDVVSDLNAALLGAGHTMRSASLALGLNHSYLSQFMRKTGYSPDVLPEDIRIDLARLLGIKEQVLKVGSPNDAAGVAVQNRPVAKVGSDGRVTEMRIDRLIEELGRIKERLDRLEARQAEGTAKSRTTTNP